MIAITTSNSTNVKARRLWPAELRLGADRRWSNVVNDSFKKHLDSRFRSGRLECDGLRWRVSRCTDRKNTFMRLAKGLIVYIPRALEVG